MDNANKTREEKPIDLSTSVVNAKIKDELEEVHETLENKAEESWVSKVIKSEYMLCEKESSIANEVNSSCPIAVNSQASAISISDFGQLQNVAIKQELESPPGSPSSAEYFEDDDETLDNGTKTNFDEEHGFNDPDDCINVVKSEASTVAEAKDFKLKIPIVSGAPMRFRMRHQFVPRFFAKTCRIYSLTEDERRTMMFEGLPIPKHFPLTRIEEKVLRKIRRKIKNKISAQESRRKKKEYVKRLERNVERWRNNNAIYKEKLSDLEERNVELMRELRDLQTLYAQMCA